MKKIYSIFLTFLFLLSSSLLMANKDGRILLTAVLTGNNEVPAVNTKAKGLVTVVLEEDRSMMTINGVFDSLSGPVTGCHFHKAVIGVAGGVVLNLGSYVKGNRIYAQIANPSKTLIAQMMSDSIYFNVHTAANTGGEIRGQVFLRTDFHLWSIMTGFNEVPVVNTQALGLASVVVSRSLSKVEYKVVVRGLSGAITGAHFHYGAADKAGPVAFSLTANGSVIAGSFDLPDLKFIDSLDAGRVYINVHTAANTGGEIRGQLGFMDGALGFDALIEGANEVPAVTTDAKALMVGWTNYTLDSIQYAVIHSGLTPTAAHFHNAAAGVNGGVITALTPYTVAPTAAYVDKIAVSNDNLNKFLKGEIYVNLHTGTNSGGEIRGQVSSSIHEGLVADLCAKQENPPTTSTASGAGYLSIDRNKLIGYFTVVTTGLTANATAAHIHKGAKGVNGGVYVGFTASASNAYSGAFIFPTTTAADSAINGLMYFNVHTAANGSGEIRGQIGKALTPDCLPTGIFELNGEQLTVKVFPNPVLDKVTLQFDSNEKMTAQVVISDLMGRSVLTQKMAVVNGDNQLEVDTNALSRGIYFLQLTHNGKILFAEKVVKQ